MLTIKKLGYSVRPWRLVDEDGKEITRPQRLLHPTLGETSIEVSIGGETRKACEAEALWALETLLRLQRIYLPRDTGALRE